MQRMKYFIAMKIYLKFICLLCISRNVLGQGESIDYDDEISYQELINMNASCYPSDSCEQERTDDSPVPTFGLKCSCHKQCWEYGTCCIDSPHRNNPPIQKCINVVGTSDSYYMVHRCPDNTKADSIEKDRCEKELNKENDILMFSPVTSLDTSTTYKNYYCLRCHETTDKFEPWNIFVGSTHNVSGEISNHNVFYNQSRKTWMANLDEDRLPVPVNLSFQYPRNAEIKRISCDRDVIDDCPDSWTDRRVHKKCLAYTAVVYQGLSSYKNAHCALCNDVSLDDLTCNKTAYEVLASESSDGSCEDEDHVWNPYTKQCEKSRCLVPGTEMCRKKVSAGGRPERRLFDLLLDGIGEQDKKCDDGDIFDPFTKTCRKLVCLNPTYVVKNGVCVKP